jgi:hypothetical protein
VVLGCPESLAGRRLVRHPAAHRPQHCVVR